jgi:hypothetical protein
MSLGDQSPEDEAVYREASRRYAIKRGLVEDALVFGVVNTGLAVFNLLTTPHQLWFIYPLFGWGIGLAAHALTSWHTLSGGHDRGIAAEMRRLRARRDQI